MINSMGEKFAKSFSHLYITFTMKLYHVDNKFTQGVKK